MLRHEEYMRQKERELNMEKKFNYTDHSEVPDVELQLVEDCADCPAHMLDIQEINEFLTEYHNHFDDGDGQPSWEQEWKDFGEVYSDEPDYI
jgi:hypothetical protein